MAYTTVKRSLTTKNGVNYDLEYDTETGGVQVLQQNAPAGTAPIYLDGSFAPSATTLGYSSTEQTQLHQQIIGLIQNAHTAVGGVNSGAKLPQWAAPASTNNQPGQTSVNPQSGGGGLGTIISSLLDPAQALENAASKFDGQVGNEDVLFGSKNDVSLTYPNDLMHSQQDHFRIAMYSYKPSKGKQLFGSTGKVATEAAKNILKYGTQSSSTLKDHLGTVFLPMPQSVTDSNNVSWGRDEMSNLAAAATAQTAGNFAGALGAAGVGAGLGGIMQLLTGAGNAGAGAKTALQAGNLFNLIKNGAVSDELASLLGTEATSKILKAQGFAVSPESILARSQGLVPNSNLELLFNSPQLRQFAFSYRLSPRSAAEARSVRRIIRFFKQGMSAKKANSRSGEGSFFLQTPNVFQLEYRNGTKEINGVNKFKTCALVGFSVNYTPDNNWAAYDGGQPVSTIIQMQFSELEPIFDTDYQENNRFPTRGDLFSVNSDSVGY